MKFKQRKFDEKVTELRTYAIKQGVLFGELNRKVFNSNNKFSRLYECDDSTYEALKKAIDEIAKEKN